MFFQLVLTIMPIFKHCVILSRLYLHSQRTSLRRRVPALGGEAVILFERDEQKDKSGSADPQGNAQIETIIQLVK